MKKLAFGCSFLLLLLILPFTYLSAKDFTICSYNCGGLPDHYDYLRAACMQKLTQERVNADPEMMSLIEKIQVLALKSNLHKTTSIDAKLKRNGSKIATKKS